MLTADRYIRKIQNLGLDEQQAKIVADSMISFASLIVNSYWSDKSHIENPSITRAKTEQVSQ